MVLVLIKALTETAVLAVQGFGQFCLFLWYPALPLYAVIFGAVLENQMLLEKDCLTRRYSDESSTLQLIVISADSSHSFVLNVEKGC